MDKLDAPLQHLLQESPPPDGPVAVMIRTPDGLQAEDRQAVEKVGGTVKADLHIVDAFSADLSVEGIRSLLSNPRFLAFYHDAPVKMLEES